MADEIDQNEIERLLGEAKSGGESSDASESSEASAPSDESGESDADGGTIDQDDIDALLKQGSQPASPPPRSTSNSQTNAPDEESVSAGDVEFLLDQAQSALASIDGGSGSEMPAGIEVFQLEEFGRTPPSPDAATLELVRDVELDLRIELGRTHMYLEDVLKLRRGSVVPLDKLAGDPVDIYVNGRLVARGEVLVLNDNFCVRVAELVAGDRAKAE